MHTDTTTAARKAAYRARANAHRSCGIRTNGPVPAECKRCDMVDAYRDAREQYLDAVEQLGRGDEAPTAKPVTFRRWLAEWTAHVAPVVQIHAPAVEVDVDWSVWAA